MKQLAALVEVGGAAALPPGPTWPEDRVATQLILDPSWNFLPPLALLLLGGAGFVLGGWPAMLLLPLILTFALGRRFGAWSWRWTERRAAQELSAALPRFARTRLTEFEGGAERIGRLRCAARGLALGATPDGAPLLFLVQQGRAFRIPIALIRGWGWRFDGLVQLGRDAPDLEAALAEGSDGLVLLLEDPDWPLLRHTCPEPASWARHLAA